MNKNMKKNVKDALKRAESYLLSLRGHNMWGESSSSPYSTAWALLAFLHSDSHRARSGTEWLLSHQNPDGSWGSTFRYHEKLIFTPYCLTALLLYEKKQGRLPRLVQAVRKAQRFVQASTNILESVNFPVEEAYSRMYPALWLARQNKIPYLNRFEKFKVRNQIQDFLPEQSGICDEMLNLNFVLPRAVESENTTLLQQLGTKQLPNGSWYCSVIDLTALALITLKLLDGDSQPIQKGYHYLVRSQNPDGGYPQFFPCEVFISTYVGFLITEICSRTGVAIPPWITQSKQWVLKKQNPTGSWSFTSEYPFGDIDDTSWAMVWLIKGCNTRRHDLSIKAGKKFLHSSQNEDGGFPAWPALKSDTDVTAHALLILEILGESQKKKDTIMEYLAKTQQHDGSWIPRWHHSTFYGTTQVMLGIRSYADTDVYEKALNYLMEKQLDDGSWGTAEETGLVLSTVLSLPEAPHYTDAVEKGISYLILTQNPEGSWDYRDLWIAECSYSSRPLAVTPIVAALKAYEMLF